MAEARRFVCDSCGHSIESWSDGNPYYVDEKGKKQYAYHPSRERDFCIGNDEDYLCLSCSEEFRIDSRDPKTACPKCHSEEISDTFDLDGKPCPWCKTGVLRIDSDFIAIS